ncbi:MAG TPA: hypothetical protein VGC42_13745, partial [Kofleriaceae bacterium]
AYAALGPGCRAGWHALWQALDDLAYEADDGRPATRPFPAIVLLAALDDPALRGDPRCTRLAEALRRARLAPNAMVTLARFWGW